MGVRWWQWWYIYEWKRIFHTITFIKCSLQIKCKYSFLFFVELTVLGVWGVQIKKEEQLQQISLWSSLKKIIYLDIVSTNLYWIWLELWIKVTVWRKKTDNGKNIWIENMKQCVCLCLKKVREKSIEHQPNNQEVDGYIVINTALSLVEALNSQCPRLSSTN